MKWCRCALIVVCCIGFLNSVQGQTLLPDSIQQKVVSLPKDSSYINYLNQLATNYLKESPLLSRKIATHLTELAPEINYTRGYARSLTIIGNSYWAEGVYEFAQNYYLLAARQYETINDSIGLGQTYNNLGEVYKRTGDYKKSLEYLNYSLILKKNDFATRAITLYNVAELYIALNDLQQASRYIDESLSIAIQQNDKRVIAYDYKGLGLIKFKQGQYESSLDYLVRSEKLWKELREIRALIQTYHDLADVYATLKLYDRSERYLKIASEMAELVKAPDLLVTNYRKLAQLDSVRGDFKQSLYHIHRYNKLRDSVYNLNKSQQMARLQAVYESETRERENQKLRAEKRFGESQLRLQNQIIYGISIGLFLTLIMAWILYKQRQRILTTNNILHDKNEEINTQKLAIEMQATALVKLNEELQELNKNLEARIQERTSQLILQNQKLTEYTFINAHKLRAPVSSILGLINLMEHTASDDHEAIREHLKTCSEQLDLITRQISRSLESGIFDNEENLA